MQSAAQSDSPVARNISKSFAAVQLLGGPSLVVSAGDGIVPLRTTAARQTT